MAPCVAVIPDGQGSICIDHQPGVARDSKAVTEICRVLPPLVKGVRIMDKDGVHLLAWCMQHYKTVGALR